MANQASIDRIVELLPEEANAAGWTEVRIARDIDAGNSNALILLQWWNYRAANTADWVDVSESGSSRAIGNIHKNAKDMAAYWQSIVDKEIAEQKLQDDQGRGRARMHRAVRV